mgnify:CR=1 FL=1
MVLVAHGAPDRPDDLPAFLEQVLGGPVPPALLADFRARYAAVGGGSPLTAATRRQAEALSARLGLPVYVGMCHWRPFLGEALAQARADNVQHLVALFAAPQFSPPPRLPIPCAPSVHRHPLFIESIAEKLIPLALGREVLFTVHSLPGRLAAITPDYEREARSTAATIAARCGLPSADFAFQSQGGGGGDWLGPTVESRLDAFAARGVRELVLVPLSFVADNLEVLYDIDIQLRQYASGRGIQLCRTATPGDSALFVETLTATVLPLLVPAP